MSGSNKGLLDIIMRVFYSQSSSSQQVDFSELNDYLWGIIEQSFCRYTDPTRDSPMDQSHDDTVPDCKPTVGKINETQLPVDQSTAIDSQNALQKTEEKKQKTNLKPKSIDKSIGIQPEIIQTHSMVIIRIELPEGIDESNLKISVNDDLVVIKWPFGYVEQIIPLPTGIQRERSNALIKDKVFEVLIPRKVEGDVRKINI